MQKPTSYGAWIHQPPGMQSNALATVERRLIDGVEVIALISLCSDLATPVLECIKDSFSQLQAIPDDAALRLVRAAPSMLATDVAVAIVTPTQSWHAWSGAARVYRQRSGSFTPVELGAALVQPGDWLVAATGAMPASMAGFNAPKLTHAASEFRNDALDQALQAGLASAFETQCIAVAAALIG